jgi:hypothetical protein
LKETITVFFVTWCLILQIPQQEKDEFNRASEFQITDCDNEKVYFEKQNAINFIERAKKQFDILNVRLDSSDIIMYKRITEYKNSLILSDTVLIIPY